MGVIMGGGWGRYQVQELKYAMLSHVLEVRHRVLPFYCICSTSPVGCQCVCVCVCVRACVRACVCTAHETSLKALGTDGTHIHRGAECATHESQQSALKTLNQQNTTEHDRTRRHKGTG